MTRPLRQLGAGFNPSSMFSEPDDDDEPSTTMGSDSALVLLALFCALVCLLGLVVVARCVWLRRLTAAATSTPRPPLPPPPPPPNKGLKKKVLRSLPKLTYTEECTSKFTECAICLAEFAAGDEIRELPKCGHGFHVACIDEWLRSHSSCPSCRQIPEVSIKCHKCGGCS